ncbi:MAG TPA: IclR family transcriptional regulator, partial [Gaiellaceae bacterium]|nr:IclR family transcriptional regulator [Gaiellaceae bacterium]
MAERTSTETGSTHSQSLERGLAVLSTFRSGRPLLGVSEIGREIGLGRSTTHRYVATLAMLGYLQQDPGTRKYRLGPRVVDLGFSALNSMELREVAAPHLRRLSDETGFTVNMAILDGADVVYVERCRSTQARQREIDLNLHVGARLPAYCTSLGKVLLAFRPPAEQGAALDLIDFTQRGPNTIV